MTPRLIALETLWTAAAILAMLVLRPMVDTWSPPDELRPAPLHIDSWSATGPVRGSLAAMAPAPTTDNYDSFLWLFIANTDDQAAHILRVIDEANSVRAGSGLPEAHSVILISRDSSDDSAILEPYRILYEQAGVGMQIVDVRRPV